MLVNGCRIVAVLLMTIMCVECFAQTQIKRPNILWLFAEDTSPWMGCYGDPINQGHTPNIDSLATNGVRFSRAFAPAPVCSPCRSALMGGQNQIRFNAHEHRSSRGPAKIQLPEGMKLLPQLMKQGGYWTFNLGKDDYNFVWDQKATYSFQSKSRAKIPWEALAKNQPFFGQIQTAGGKNNTTAFPKSRKVDPATVTVPADYPQNQIYREVVAQHYDAIRKDDDFIGSVLAGLDEAGLRQNTVIVYFSDHGANNLVRHKQMPTEGGLHVPLIIAGPDPWVPATSVRDDLVNLLDLSATTLAWARLPIPDWYEGQDLFGVKVVPRSFVAAAKDRLDHTLDRVRSIRSDRFRYTKNYKTDRILLQPQYRDRKNYVINLRELYASGELDPRLAKIYFGERPKEEFYDVRKDPSQVNNLIDDPAYADQIALHRQYLDRWLAKGDDGAGEESEAELAYQAKGHKWGQAVNPEYETVRQDSDGDGLSDAWEKINGRDSDDGRLQFTFDCGGWQTEGWKDTGSDLGNIAGRLGVLDFEVPKGMSSIQRSGLKLDTKRNQGTLTIQLGTKGPVKLTLLGSFDGRGMIELGDVSLTPGERLVTVPLTDQWSGILNALEIQFQSSEAARVEIDKIEIQSE